MIALKNLFDLIRWPAFVSYCILLYPFSVLPTEQLPSVLMRANDKILHTLAYFLLALLGFRAFFYSRFSFFYREAAVKAIGFSIFYGAILEWIQRGVPGRQASVTDWVVDSVGALAASLIFRISRLTRPF